MTFNHQCNALDTDSDSDHFMHLILHGLRTDCIEKKQKLEKVLLPRLLSCVSLGKHGLRKFKKMLDYFNINFKEGALLSFLIIAGEVKFLKKYKRKITPSLSRHLRRSHVH